MAATTKTGRARPAGEARAPRGRKARAEAKRRTRLDKMRARSGNRWRVHYDIDGPRVRLGLAWFVGAMVALAVGLVAIVAFFAIAFAAAAAHSLRTWRARGHDVDPTFALGATAFVVVCAAFGPRVMGLAVLALVGAAIAASFGNGSMISTIGRAGVVLQCTLPTALAGGCVVLLADREVWAGISLVLLVSAYETGDYLIGSGSANALEGPLAGLAAVLVTALVVAALGVPPFDGVGQAMGFGLAVAPLAFAGQITASGILPHSRAFAPALRRVDSLLLAAPLWYLGVDQVIF